MYFTQAKANAVIHAGYTGTKMGESHLKMWKLFLLRHVIQSLTVLPLRGSGKRDLNPFCWRLPVIEIHLALFTHTESCSALLLLSYFLICLFNYCLFVSSVYLIINNNPFCSFKSFFHRCFCLNVFQIEYLDKQIQFSAFSQKCCIVWLKLKRGYGF